MTDRTFYKIDLTVLPEIHGFSTKADTPAHRVRQSERDLTICEISFLQTGALTESSKSGERILEEGSINTFARNHRRKFLSDSPQLHEYTISLALGAPATVIDAADFTSASLLGNEAILPGHITDERLCHRLAPMVRKLAQECGEAVQENRMQAYSLLFDILHLLTEYACSATEEPSLSAQRDAAHCSSACQYIEEHLGKKISVKEVADHVGISYYYLCRLFPKVIGMNMTEYVNREKMRKAQELIAKGTMTVEQAGSAVGIDDPKYFSRLFRQYVGMTISEFKRMQKNAP